MPANIFEALLEKMLFIPTYDTDIRRRIP